MMKILVIILFLSFFYFFWLEYFLRSGGETALITITLVVTNIVVVIVAICKTTNILNWLNKSHLESRCFVENFFKKKNKLKAGIASVQFTIEVRKRTGKLGSTQLTQFGLWVGRIQYEIWNKVREY